MSNSPKIADIMDKLIAGKLAEANVEQIAEFSEYARRKLEIAERLADAIQAEWVQWDKIAELAREFKAAK